MSKIEVNQISSQCGSTLTIGQSGDTVTLASGATQSGFGRTGTVDWDTTAKTTNFTAVSGTGYFVNTTSGAITVTLPATPSGGDIVAIFDYARTFGTNAVTVGRNGSLIQGVAIDGTISTNGQSTTFIYVDGTKGWVPTEDQTTGNYGAQYITATGGTITTCGDYKIHTFTGPGTFTVCSVGNPAGSDTVDYLVVAGGGGGGGEEGGGGGAGGYRESSGAASGCYTVSPLGACVSALPVTATGYPITVGSGGAGITSCGVPSTSGNPSIFSTITSTGGGRGGDQVPGTQTGSPGGSGGGGNANPGPSGYGSGNTPPVSPPQGNDGGGGVARTGTTNEAGGGGGGAIAAGTVGSNSPNPGGTGGPGGDGATSSINGTPTARAGGGGAGTAGSAGVIGLGGLGGGGNGTKDNTTAQAGTANTGGGGGGGGGNAGVAGGAKGGNGGSGIVIIRYKYQ